MTGFGGTAAHRVLLRQALGGDEFVRVTWHEDKGVVVFSHWSGDTCTTATPVRIDELGGLATMLVTAISQPIAVAAPKSAPWPAPEPSRMRPAPVSSRLA